MFSIICAYNNKIILNNYLLKSLTHQTVNYELILIDNSRNQFKSSAKVMNEVSAKATGNYLMYVHQDIDLISDSCLEEIETILDGISNLGVAGVAGKTSYIKGTLTNIKHGEPPEPAGVRITSPIRVQTVDSCLAIVPRNVLMRLQFDEKTIRGWYHFLTDYCLSIEHLGYAVYVIPVDLYHCSTGSLSLRYYIDLMSVLLKHRQHKVIYTTMGDWGLNNYFFNVFKNMVNIHRHPST